MAVPYNDIVSISADVVNKACLAALGATAIGITLPPYAVLALLVLASASGTLQTHVLPVGVLPLPRNAVAVPTTTVTTITPVVPVV